MEISAAAGIATKLKNQETQIHELLKENGKLKLDIDKAGKKSDEQVMQLRSSVMEIVRLRRVAGAFEELAEQQKKRIEALERESNNLKLWIEINAPRKKKR